MSGTGKAVAFYTGTAVNSIMELRVNIPNSRLAPNPVLSNSLALGSIAGEGAFLGDSMNCRYCGLPGERQYNKHWHCKKHARFTQMRIAARYYKKTVPTIEALEIMGREIGPSLSCPHCKQQMNWFANDGAGSTVTLQHDRSGEMRLLCHSCNIQHAYYPGDTFYEVPLGMKHCKRCEKTLLLTEFGQAKEGRNGKRFYCKKCHSEYNRELRLRNLV